MASQSLHALLAGLRAHGLEPKRSNTGWSCRCPAHDDRKPSLTIAEGDDGRVLVKCHAGCTAPQIVAAIGMTMRDLAPVPGTANGPRRTQRSKATGASNRTESKPAKSFSTSEAAIKAWVDRYGECSHRWAYAACDGSAVGFVLRWNRPSGKIIKPVALIKGRWQLAGMAAPRPLYKLPDLLKLPSGARIYVVEGEKAADAAWSIGMVATTSAHGAESPHLTDWTPVRDKEVVVFPDNDEAGEKYAAEVSTLAFEAGAASVQIVRLPGLPNKGDIVEFIAARAGDPEGILNEIERHVAAAPLEGSVPLASPVFAPISAADLIRRFPALRPVVIDGVLRLGESMNLVSGPKIGKTWQAHDLAGAVASGGEWLGRATRQGKVLIIDAELHDETLAFRLDTMQKRRGLDHDTMRSIDTWRLRGQVIDIDAIEEALRDVAPSQYTLIIVDALYRFIPLEGEENSNETMTRVYNTVDAIAGRLNAGIVLVHHSTKGDQSNKAITDVGSGGSAQGRAADTHLIMRPHEVDGAVVVDGEVRSFPKLKPFVIRWANPGWDLAPDLDPTKLKRPNRRTKDPTAKGDATEPPPAMTPQLFAEKFASVKAEIREEIIARARESGLGKGQAEALFDRAIEAGVVFVVNNGPCDKRRFTTKRPELSFLGADAGGAGEGGEGPAPPSPPVLSARGGCGGGARPPSPPPPAPRKTKNQQKKRNRGSEQ